MEEKRSRKPLFISLLLVIVGVLVAAMVATPQITPTKAEEKLDAATLIK